MKKNLLLSFIFKMFTTPSFMSKNDFYEKIDLFGEVLEKYKKIMLMMLINPKLMDSAINGVLQSLDPYSAYMSPELLKKCKLILRGEFGGLGIEIGMEAGVVKVIHQLMIHLQLKQALNLGDYIVKIGKEQVQGKSLWKL